MTREEIVQLIIHHTRQVIPGLADHTFDRNESLRDLGANSIDRAEIVMLVQESLSLRVPRVELFGPKNIGELADLLHARLQERSS